MREQVEREAAAAADAVAELSDDGVTRALERAAVLVNERHDAIAAANADDVAAATLDQGALDRLRLDDTRIAALGDQLAELAALPPLDRAEDAWELENGLRISVLRIPIGAVGANFEARPNVAVDVAGQLLKSLNGAVLRTGGAALRTVTVLVDERPDGVHLSYDRMASFLAPYANADVFAVARNLDNKIEDLLQQAAAYVALELADWSGSNE